MSIYRDVSPVLISRFGDREETVRLEVWATYVSLLNQTAVYGAFATKEDSLRGKRKRDVEPADTEDSPFTLLNAQVPSLAKALLSQLKSPKTSPTTLQSGFTLLKSLLEVLPGSLTSQIPLITTTCKTVLSQPSTTSTSQLYTSCLSFLALFFSTHPSTSYSASLPSLTPVLIKALQEKHPRVASEAFRVFSSLLNSTKPVTDASWPDSVYSESLARLVNHDTDADVRSATEDVMADLWICATDSVKGKDRKEWEVICRSTGNTEGAVRVITKVAQNVVIDDNWVNGCNEWLLGLLKKSGRSGKSEIFVALSVLLNRFVFIICQCALLKRRVATLLGCLPIFPRL
jgi:cullin-associated NEDD8-dissociated protein 1